MQQEECFECGKVLKPMCNTKKENGRTYCATCHWELFGRDRLLGILDNATKKAIEEMNRPGCLRMGGLK